jgi:hypothetical protein
VHIEGAKEMKPVAWMNSKGDIILPAHQANKEYNIPLYTVPKELSDEEIEGAFYQQCWYYDEDEKFDYYGFAKEILKRASEK